MMDKNQMGKFTVADANAADKWVGIIDAVNYEIGRDNVLIGPGVRSGFDECVVVGVGITATADRQLIIGNRKVRTSKIMTDAEFAELTVLLKKLSSRRE